MQARAAWKRMNQYRVEIQKKLAIPFACIVFALLGAPLFYGRLLLALWRGPWPAHALVLLWRPVALLPRMLSEGAPNFLRPIAVLGTMYALPAIAIDALQRWLAARDRRWRRPRHRPPPGSPSSACHTPPGTSGIEPNAGKRFLLKL